MKRLIEPVGLSLWALLALSGAAVSDELFAFALYALLLSLHTLNLEISWALTMLRKLSPVLLAVSMSAAQEQLLQETGPLEWGNLSLSLIIGAFLTQWSGGRLRAPRRRRELWLIALSVTQLCIGTLVRVDMGFLFLAGSWLIAASCLLFLSYLESIAEGPLHQRETISWPLKIHFMSLLTLSGLFTLIFFSLLPRFRGDISFISLQRRAGFSAEVHLDEAPLDLSDTQIAFRVELDPPPEPGRGFYLKGDVLDDYRQGRWYRRRGLGARRSVQRAHRLPLNAIGARMRYQKISFQARSYLNLFSIDGLARFRVQFSESLRPRWLRVDQAGVLHAAASTPLTLEAWSIDTIDEVPIIEARAPLWFGPIERYRRRASQEVDAAYLQLPATLDERIPALARRWGKNGESAAALTDALSRALREGYRYDLSPPIASRERGGILPFLFESRAGQCRHFSTALTLLARSLGIPARVISGYHSSEWNESGSYLVVRERHAHAWVELWTDTAEQGRGAWRRIDVTPPMALEQPLAPAVSHWLDALRYQWLRYVIGYDRETQRAAYETIKTRQEALYQRWAQTIRQRLRDLKKRGPGFGLLLSIGASVLILLCGLLLWVKSGLSCRDLRLTLTAWWAKLGKQTARGRLRQRELDRHRADRLRGELSARYKRWGGPWRSGETAPDWRARLDRLEAPALTLLDPLLEWQQRARYAQEVEPFPVDLYRQWRSALRTPPS
ncbi:MAG: transglutaminase domain-containing protein [Myxococcota bacterium]|nr:transglutaminase domain-containing protein [Myxococcota bacterium]